MYNILMHLIQLGVAVAALFSEKVRKMYRGEREAFSILENRIDPSAEYAWFHAASLGEFEQGRPIMERLRAEHPEYKILLTFFSPSGYEVRKNYNGADIVCYMPIDTPSNARRFVRLANPALAFFIKYEFWYNFLNELWLKGTPVYSVSSIFRRDQVFFRWYGMGYKKVLGFFKFFFVQNEESKSLLAGIGHNNVMVTGDTRFDRVLQIKIQAKRLPVVEAFAKSCKVLVAGSSWPPDEDIFIRYFNEHSGWRLIVAPHVIGEDHLRQILSKLNRKAVRYTQATMETAATAECLIIDCFGLLSSIYNYGDVAYVGGGFGVGIHNVLEAAVWDMPVIFGPNNKNFIEAQGLKAAGGGFEIAAYEDFAALMDRFASDAEELSIRGCAAGGYVKNHSGSTNMIMKEVFAR